MTTSKAISVVRRYALSPSAFLALGAVLYAWVQLDVIGVEQPLEWDEAVYWTQVVSGPSAPYLETRAPGIVLIAWPASLLTRSVETMRAYLAGCSALLFFIALRPWISVAGRATAGATLLLLAVWPAVYYGSSLSPNLFAAFALAGAFGYGLRCIQDHARWEEAALVALCFLACLLRPSDAVLALLPLGLASLLLRRFRLASLLALGVALGAVAWIVEAELVFSGTLERLSAAASHVGSDKRKLAGYVAHLQSYEQGQLLREVKKVRDASHATATWKLLCALGLVATVVAGVRRNRELFAVLLAALLAAVAVALFYFERVTLQAPRFLLPCYLLLIPHAVVLARMLLSRCFLWIPLAALAMGAAHLMLWSVDIADRVQADMARSLRGPKIIGVFVASLVPEGEPCAIDGRFGRPQLVFYSGCHPGYFREKTGEFGLPDSPGLRKRIGRNVFYTSPKGRFARRNPYRRWERIRVPKLRRWKVFRPRSVADIPD